MGRLGGVGIDAAGAVAAVEAESGLTLAGTEARVAALEAAHHKAIFFSRDMSLASGSQVVTGFGFTPRYVDFEAMLASDWIGQQSQGWDNGGVSSLSFYSQHNDTANSHSNVADVSILMAQTSANSYRGQISSLDADGFTFAWVKGGTPTGTMVVIARGHK